MASWSNQSIHCWRGQTGNQSTVGWKRQCLVLRHIPKLYGLITTIASTEGYVGWKAEQNILPSEFSLYTQSASLPDPSVQTLTESLLTDAKNCPEGSQQTERIVLECLFNKCRHAWVSTSNMEYGHHLSSSCSKSSSLSGLKSYIWATLEYLSTTTTTYAPVSYFAINVTGAY